MTTLIKFIVGLLTALMLTSCNFDISLGQERGNGNVVTQDFTITEDFNEVTASKGWEVFLEKGSTNAVTVEADENLIDIAEIYVHNGDLKISAEKNIGSATSKKVFVTYASNLQDISVNSGSTLTTKEPLDADELELGVSSGGVLRAEATARDLTIDVSSGGVMRLSGTTENLNASTSSGGVVKAKDLSAKNADADASSGGVMNIQVTDRLKANASSGGTIRYSGNPSEIDKPKKSYSGGSISAEN